MMDDAEDAMPEVDTSSRRRQFKKPAKKLQVPGVSECKLRWQSMMRMGSYSKSMRYSMCR